MDPAVGMEASGAADRLGVFAVLLFAPEQGHCLALFLDGTNLQVKMLLLRRHYLFLALDRHACPAPAQLKTLVAHVIPMANDSREHVVVQLEFPHAPLEIHALCVSPAVQVEAALAIKNPATVLFLELWRQVQWHLQPLAPAVALAPSIILIVIAVLPGRRLVHLFGVLTVFRAKPLLAYADVWAAALHVKHPGELLGLVAVFLRVTLHSSLLAHSC